ncbi:MAG TPA: polymer-forming cytoskeletal protein [Anaeromyxobacteraceae bacterium]|nr:polymer-forming cytoskeletal protein [Anaeromyxobacteraceae bacterium]
MATPTGSTVIGESILINGSLNGDEDLTVRGRVEGTLTLTKTLVVEPSGIVKAEVQVKNCIIAGVVVGNVTASESIEITKEGRMVGDISSPRVIIVDGASFRGRVDMGEVDLAGERPRPASRPAARPALPSRPAPARKAEAKPKEEKAPPKLPGPPAAVGMGAVKKKVVVRRK